MPIKFRILFKLNQIAHNIFYRTAPDYLTRQFSKFQKNHNINLRDGTGRDHNMFEIELSRNKKESILYKIKKEWNSLPLNIRSTNDHQKFKRKLKTHLYKIAFPENMEETNIEPDI